MFLVKGCNEEKNFKTTQEIEGFTCQSLKSVEIVHRGSNNNQCVLQLEELVLQWTKGIDGVRISFSQREN